MACEDGWEAPFKTSDTGAKLPKPNSWWTDDEKNFSKYNARGLLNAIFGGVDENEFKLIQGCIYAKA